MKLITEDILSRNLPNALATVEGEVSLFDKLTPFLDTAEQWLIDNLTSETTFNAIVGYSEDNVLKKLAIRIVVNRAFADAIPSLDLVLTPNGFGIVSNQNVTPASSDRVKRLIASLRSTADNCILSLQPLLVTAHAWQSSSLFQFYSSTLFPDISLSRLAGCGEPLFDNYLRLRQRVLLIEDTLADKYISPELYAVLRQNTILGALTTAQRAVVDVLRSVELDCLNDKPINEQTMLSLVNRLRTNSDDFPEWQSSATAERYSLLSFENHQKSGGYWW